MGTPIVSGPGSASSTYTEVCRLADIEVEGGVAALVEGAAVAIFRTHDGNVYAMSNFDPMSRASVLSRGILGTRGDIPFVTSPMFKQAFDLRTGQCLDDAAVRIQTYDVQVVDGTVLVGDPHPQHHEHQREGP
ncbi:nitrite reductase small subunit NirD [Nocardioides sp.]|uniref:nitrite reductase small subunit NirD n=1 Tax=Nocardioides sp. TaxID=35761 RepID=UPI0031FF2896|nr:assimilatory nitrite reductase small subunit [Nocardioides sp.]